MKIEIDGTKKVCPVPVILTKKELDKEEVNIVETIVDNEVAKENVSKLGNSLGYEVEASKEGDNYRVTIIKGEGSLVSVEDNKSDLKDMTVAFSADVMGRGDDGLGKILIKSYMYTLSEAAPYPKTLLFYNTGVNLTCEGSEVLEDLKLLESKGVEIISCGTCLDYLGRKDDLKIGSISNMYTIYEKLRDAESNITI